MTALAETTGYLSLEQAACQEGNSFRQAAGKAEKLIGLLEQRGIPLSGRIMTGLATREEKERQVIIFGEKRGGIRSVRVSVSETPKNKLLHWVGDVMFTVPASISWSLKNGFEENRNWASPQAQIAFRTYGQEETRLTPNGPNSPHEKIIQISQALYTAIEVIGSVGQNRTVKKDLTGTTLVLD